MNDEESNDDAELMVRVVQAFERMPVPAPPAEGEIANLLRRAEVEALNPGPWRSGNAWLRLSRWQRLTLGGIGLSTAAAVLIAIVALQSTTRLSAMERMAKQLRDVTSYSYVVSSTTTESAEGGKRTTTWSEQGQVFWRAPEAFRFEDRITKSLTPIPADGPPQELLEHFVEVFPSGKPGVLLDHRRKTFLKEGFAPEGSKTYPWQPLRMIREGRPEVTGDLGTRQIAGRQSHGYVTRFESGDAPRPHLWHVWVDSETDLPLELGYEVDDHNEPRTTTVLRVSDFRWNAKLDPSLFDPVVPKGYNEVSPQREEKN